MNNQKNFDERCLTGISGLDELLEGGLPQGKSMILIGGPGSGKTIFLSQFIHNGIKKYNEPGIFITFHESSENIKENMLKLGWNFTELESQKKIQFLDISPLIYLSPEEMASSTVFGLKMPESSNIKSMVASVKKNVDAMQAKRIVIDGINSLSLYESDKSKIRIMISQLFQGLLRTGCTCLFSSEVKTSSLERTFQIEEFLSDGVIILHRAIKSNKLTRIIRIDKMRGISHDLQPHPYDITSKGIVVFPKDMCI